jgi:hypothetical protein
MVPIDLAEEMGEKMLHMEGYWRGNGRSDCEVRVALLWHFESDLKHLIAHFRFSVRKSSNDRFVLNVIYHIALILLQNAEVRSFFGTDEIDLY